MTSLAAEETPASLFSAHMTKVKLYDMTKNRRHAAIYVAENET
jgi:hypothetical protein